MTSADMPYIQRVMNDLDKTRIANSHAPRVNTSNVIFDIKVVVRSKDGGTLGEIENVFGKGMVFFPRAAEFEGYKAPEKPKGE